MANIYTESFEATIPTNNGYDNANWVEEKGNNCTVNPDYTGITPPTGGGNHILRLVSITNGYYARAGVEFSSPSNISYSSIFFRLVSESVADDEPFDLFYMIGSDFTDAYIIQINQSAGNLYLWSNIKYDGNDHYYQSDSAISLGTWYQLDVKWDITNHAWEWKLGDGANQASQDSGTLSASHALGLHTIYLGDRWNARNYEACIDLLKIDDATWPTYGGNYSLSCDPAAYLLTGQAANLALSGGETTIRMIWTK